MIDLEPIVSALQHKITEYRGVQQVAWRARGCLRVAKEELHQSTQQTPSIISKQIDQLKMEATERVSAVGAFCSNLLRKQQSAYESQIFDLRGEISRQYKVITLLKQELQDLMIMLNQRRIAEQNSQSSQLTNSSQNNGESNVAEPSQTINGLQIIEEEQTERTIMSSANSFHEDARFTNSQNFIRIQQKVKGEFSQGSSIHEPESQLIQSQAKQWNDKQCAEEEWASSCKFQKLFQSEVSRRQNTQQKQAFQEQIPSAQWESLPLSVEGAQSMQTQQLWEGHQSFNQLRQITNQVEQERQSKTKMFLEQFRKTFNKCLNSTNVSRKNSKNLSRPPKDKPKPMSTTFGKIEPEPHSNSQNQKIITDMLKDLDNNHKFSVGHRRSELKYQGEKKDGARHGQAVLYYSNGLSYQGQFRNNLRHGFGVLKFNQIQIYKGEWASDELTGQGKIRNFAVINKRKSQVSQSPLSRWVSYCGSFRGNRFEGQGTLYLQGGQKFLGRFICGSACGAGTLYKKNGEVETGVWRHNNLVQQF